MPPRIGVVAGAGNTPERGIAACRNSGRNPYVIGLEDQADPASFSHPPDARIRFGQAGKGVRLLKSAGGEEVVPVGGVTRPPIRSLCPDAKTARFLFRIGRSYYRDGSILNAIVSALEAEGLRVVAPETFVRSLVAEARVYGNRAPNPTENADIRRGFEVARALGALDIGQGVIVQKGRVIGLEAAEGTHALIERCAPLLTGGEGGVLVKACKPEQDTRIDLPKIGPRTVANAARAGLAGIAVGVKRALILDADTFTIVNLILDRPAIPEFFQEKCTGGRLAEPALRLLRDADARRTQREAAATALAALRPQGKSPSVGAAEVILDVVRRRSGARSEQGAFR